jgi:hypothetical protein
VYELSHCNIHIAYIADANKETDASDLEQAIAAKRKLIELCNEEITKLGRKVLLYKSNQTATDIAQLSIQISSSRHTPGMSTANLQSRHRELTLEFDTGLRSIENSIADMKDKKAEHASELEKLQAELTAVRTGTKPAHDAFVRLSQISEQILDPTCTRYTDYRDFKENDPTYQKCMSVLVNKKIVRTLAEKLQPHEEALSLTQDKLISLKTQASMPTYGNTVQIKLPIPGSDKISKEALTLLQESIKDSVIELEKVVHEKSVAMFENIKEHHQRAISIILEEELPTQLDCLKDQFDKVYIASGPMSTVFTQFVKEIKGMIKTKVKQDIARSKSLASLAEEAAKETKAADARVKAKIAERADQIIIEEDADTLADHALEKETGDPWANLLHEIHDGKFSDMRKMEVNVPTKAWSKISEDLKQAIITWNRTCKRDSPPVGLKDKVAPLLNKMKDAVKNGTLQSNTFPWLPKTSAKRPLADAETKETKEKRPHKRPRHAQGKPSDKKGKEGKK